MSRCSEASSRTKSSSIHGECRCGLDAPLMTSWTDANPGRRFYGCGMYKIQGYKRCNHFVWYDEEMGPRAKDMISKLNQRLNIANLKIDEGKIQEDELNRKIKKLNTEMKTLKFLIAMMVMLNKITGPFWLINVSMYQFAIYSTCP
ncbi:uncharacterized protein At4g04775-like [Vicia villosa]|uniref:uncharacterized protein At4g04775-like n=1 Tax=Vicia villosa TaxID=3911 RepID=UPI00273C3818|nr:uncharacterized protein At4g04775-like [Vicia villosa]